MCGRPVNEPALDQCHVLAAVAANPAVEFILNVPKETRTTGDALREASRRRIAIGGMGDFMRALSERTPGLYIHPNVRYVSRILSQHAKVTFCSRLDDSRYSVALHSGATIVAMIANDYEVTADAIRSVIARYPEFDVYVISNPNARGLSPEAVEAATQGGMKLYLWAEFMSALHRM